MHRGVLFFTNSCPTALTNCQDGLMTQNSILLLPSPACQIPAEVLDAAPLLLKQRFALHLLRDVLQGGKVPGAALQLVKLLAVPQLGWENDTDALTSEVKLQVTAPFLLSSKLHCLSE